MEVKKKKLDLPSLQLESEESAERLNQELKKIGLRESWLEQYNNCDLCGGELLYTHVTNFVEGNVDEEALCPSCHIKNKKVCHVLQ